MIEELLQRIWRELSIWWFVSTDSSGGRGGGNGAGQLLSHTRAAGFGKKSGGEASQVCSTGLIP